MENKIQELTDKIHRDEIKAKNRQNSFIVELF